MKRIPALLLLLTLLAESLTGCVLVVDNTMPKVIGVVSKKDDSSFWNTVLSGAEDAALQNGYAITFRGPLEEGHDGVEEQKKIIDLALENEVCGLVVAGVGPGLEDRMEICHERNIPVIQFDSGLYPKDLAKLKKNKVNPVIASVYTDNVAAGELAAEKFFLAVRQDLVLSLIKYKLGVLQHDRTAAGEERCHGFLTRFEELAEADPETRGKYEIFVEKCVTEADNAYGKALDRLRSKGVRGVFLTNQEAVNQVYDQIQEHPNKYDFMVFAGFDAGKKQVAWMQQEEGARLLGSVIQNSYALGYNAVLQCISGLEARGVTAFVELDCEWYDLDNLQEMQDKGLVYE